MRSCARIECIVGAPNGKPVREPLGAIERPAAVRFLVALLAAAIAWSPGVAVGGERSVALGEHYQVLCHFENARLAEAALETAEAVWPLADKLFAIHTAAPIKPLDIHLYRTIHDYQVAEAALTDGRFRDNLAFSHRRSRASHIAIQPPCTDATLAITGLPALTRYQIAHEAFHLACYSAPLSNLALPRWLKEGSATWAAQRAMETNGWSNAAAGDPYSATRMDRAQRLLAAGTLPTVREILRKGCGHLARNDRYAVYWTFMRFMADDARREDLAAVLRQAARPTERPKRQPSKAALVETPISAKRLARLGSDFKAHVRSLAPMWREETRSLHVRGDVCTQVAFADEAAVAWRKRPVGRSAYRLSGSLEFLPNPGRRMDLLVGRSETDHICVSFIRGFGLHVTRVWAKDERREDLGIARAQGIEPGRPVVFEVHVANGRLNVTLNGSTALAVPLGDKDMTGRWGLSAQPGAGGIWRSVRVRTADD